MLLFCFFILTSSGHGVAPLCNPSTWQEEAGVITLNNLNNTCLSPLCSKHLFSQVSFWNRPQRPHCFILEIWGTLDSGLPACLLAALLSWEPLVGLFFGAWRIHWRRVSQPSACTYHSHPEGLPKSRDYSIQKVHCPDPVFHATLYPQCCPLFCILWEMKWKSAQQQQLLGKGACFTAQGPTLSPHYLWWKCKNDPKRYPLTSPCML